MKDKLLKMIKAKEDMRAQRKAEIKKDIENAKDSTEIRGLYTQLNKEMDTLDGEIKEYRSMVAEMEEAEKRNDPADNDPNIASKIPDGTEPQKRNTDPIKGNPKDPQEPQKRSFNVLSTYSGNMRDAGLSENYEQIKQQLESRGKALKEGRSAKYGFNDLPLSSAIKRSVTIGGGQLVVPDRYSNTLNDTFNQISSLVDLVNAVPLNGGESYTKGFVKPSLKDGDYTTEGADYTDTDPQFGSIPINKTKITSYSEISEEVKKLPDIDYQSYIATEVRNALRRKIAKEILVGNPTSEAQQLTGIFHAPTAVIPDGYDMAINTIDKDTLDKIVFGYGGDENVEAPAYLMLNKSDLAAFAAIRDKQDRKLYTITINGNTGTISSAGSFSVNFVINSICPTLSDSSTAVGTSCMAYGILKNYEMPIFSDVDVQISTDFKFKQGMICYRGSVFVGGNVAAWKGFMRIKKGPVTP